MQNFPKVCTLKMLFKDNFLELTVAIRFQKYEYFKKRQFSFPFFQSTVYNNVVVTKQIHFLNTFLKSWVRIYDDIAGVIGGPHYYQREFRFGEQWENYKKWLLTANLEDWNVLLSTLGCTD